MNSKDHNTSQSLSQSLSQTSSIQYVLHEDLREAVMVAEMTSRPLLIRGEPGTGKTLLAEYIAAEKNLTLYKWHIKSTSQAVEGLYFYDAVTRLNDSRFGNEEVQAKVQNIDHYIRYGALGQCFASDVKAMALIDEIDKADIEFPNDLLHELDQMEFTIPENGKKIKAKIRPLVIITSNNEKELPDAFLRRCIFHYIKFPDYSFMEKIVRAHFPHIGEQLIDYALTTFYRLREIDDLRKKPSTSELIDWMKILLGQGAQLEALAVKGKKIPYLGSLIKNEEDHAMLGHKTKK